MKKVFVLFLCLVSVFIVFSCDGNGSGGGNGCDATTTPDDGNNQDDGSDCLGACGSDAKVVNVTTRSSGEYGSIDFMTASNVGFVSLKTTLTVPKRPSGSTTQGTLFIWPGLMPGAGSGMLSRGVIQPVLTWGSSCADMYAPKDTWWIAGMYVTGMGVCYSGDSMTVDIGDKLDIEITNNGTMWTQVVTNQSNGRSVTYSKSMNGKTQWWALFAIEIWEKAVKPTEDVIFTDTVLTFAGSAPAACMPSDIGPTDWLTSPHVSKDGTTCCIPKIILRAKGVAATTPNAP